MYLIPVLRANVQSSTVPRFSNKALDHRREATEIGFPYRNTPAEPKETKIAPAQLLVFSLILDDR